MLFFYFWLAPNNKARPLIFCEQKYNSFFVQINNSLFLFLQELSISTQNALWARNCMACIALCVAKLDSCATGYEQVST